MNIAKTNIMVNSISKGINIISDNSLSGSIHFIQISDISFLQISLNTIPKTPNLCSYNFILIEPLYNKLVKHVIFNYANIQLLSKEDFFIGSVLVIKTNVGESVPNS